MKTMQRVLGLVLMSALILCAFAGVSAQEEKTTIVVMTRWSGSEPLADYFPKFIEEFEAANPTVKVENISISEEASYNNKFKTLMATGDVPNIFYLPGIASLVKYAENGLIISTANTSLLNGAVAQPHAKKRES